jgi:hypothetical protein
MFEHSEPTNTSSVFFDLPRHQNLTFAGGREYLFFLPNGYQLMCRLSGLLFRIASMAFPGAPLPGDNRVLVIEARA